MDLFEQFQSFLVILKNEPEEVIRQIYELFNAEIGEHLADPILRRGEMIELKVGDLLFSEDSVSPHVGKNSQIFIVMTGQIFARKKITEATFEKTTYGKGDIVGIEKIIAWVGEKISLFPKSLYRETAMAGSNDVIVMGLTAEQCLAFLRIYPKTLTSQLKRWVERASDSEQLLVEFAQVAKGMELDLQTMSNAEKVINELIAQGEGQTLAGVLMKLKRTLDEYNKFFLELEETSREKDEKIQNLQKRFEDASYAFLELTRILPDRTHKVTFAPAKPGSPNLDQIIESLFKKLREKNSQKD